MAVPLERGEPQAEVLVEAGAQPGLTLPVATAFTVGRDIACELAVFDTQISRRHLRIARDPTGFVVEDLGSSNGTFVNGARVSAARIYHRDEICCGTVRLRFLCPACLDPGRSSVEVATRRRSDSEIRRGPPASALEFDPRAAFATSADAGAGGAAARAMRWMGEAVRSAEPSAVYEALLHAADDLLRCRRVVVCRYNPVTRNIIPMTHRRAADDPPGGKIHVDLELVERCCQTGLGTVRPVSEGGREIGVPLSGRRAVVGALIAAVGPDVDPGPALPWLGAVATQCGWMLEELEAHAVAVQQGLRLEELNRLAEERAQALSAEQAKLRERDEQLQRAQRMEAIGRLAGGIAHDFNNILTAILGYTELQLLHPALPGDLRETVDQVRKAGRRAAALTQQLLAFSRKQVLQPRVLDLNVLVRELEPMLRRLIGEHLGLRVELDPALGAVRADPARLEQVVLNLVVNACDAMTQGGTLTLRTANRQVDAPWLAEAAPMRAAVPGERPDPVREGAYVELTVADTGTGMDRATVQRIFEPFFTTKSPGKGTGLGLSTVYGIVAQSGGDVWVRSERGRGSTFSVLLPRVAAEAPAPDAPGAPETAGHGSATVLVAEDDPDVRALVIAALSRKGYRVLAAADGLEALELEATHPGPIEVLLTDVVMPRMGGDELARRLTQRRPATKVIYMSGHTDSALVQVSSLALGAGFLQKPFLVGQVVDRVREALKK